MTSEKRVHALYSRIAGDVVQRKIADQYSLPIILLGIINISRCLYQKQLAIHDTVTGNLGEAFRNFCTFRPFT